MGNSQITSHLVVPTSSTILDENVCILPNLLQLILDLSFSSKQASHDENPSGATVLHTYLEARPPVFPASFFSLSAFNIVALSFFSKWD